MTASDLRVGDWLVTRIGTAPIKSIEPKADGFEIVVDAHAEGATRSAAQGTVLFYWRRQPVKVRRKAPAPRVPSPLRGFLAAGGSGGRP